MLPELVRFQQEYILAAIDESRDESVSEDDDFDPPIALIPNATAISEGQIPRVALSDAAFYALIQENIDINRYDLAIIALKKILVLVLDGASTYKG